MKHWFPDGAVRAPGRFAPAGRAWPERPAVPTVALLTAAQMQPLLGAWSALEARAAEPNPFYSADMAFAAIRHLRDSQGLSFLVVRDTGAAAGDAMLALLPMRQSWMTLNGKALNNWQNALFPLGAPLIDRDRGVEALSAALGFLGLGKSSGAALILRQIAADGPVADMMREAADRFSLPAALINPTSRATLSIGGGAGDLNRKRARELARQRRRLAERGAATLAISADYEETRRALEDFLTLEAAGWKGERGTALVQEPGSASFTRAALWPMAKAGKARVATLALDGEVIAACVILHGPRVSYLWKIAYDESLAAYAPGVQLIDHIGATLGGVQGPDLRMIDSCAIQGNRMIENLWTGRRPICDFIVGLNEDDASGFNRALSREALRQGWREKAKAIYNRLRGRA
jgi:CelD/BcsL family acetyltransferase involved in cellulose biosynthesis